MPGRFPLTPVALINDPFCEDNFCGDAPTPPPFDTTLYTYARFIGTKIGRYKAGGLADTGGTIRIQTEANSTWLRIGNSSADGCFLAMRPAGKGTTPGNPPGNVSTPEAHWKWVCNYDSWVITADSAFIASPVVATWWFRNGILVNNIDSVIAGNISKVPPELYATCRGKWQFLNSASTSSTLPAATPADAEWIGNYIPDGAGFNAAATWETPPTVPPYTYV